MTAFAQFLPAETAREMPWKNGGGLTREIARAPLEGDFLWRLAVAEISREGPFSVFAGYDRFLTLLDEKILLLLWEEGRQKAISAGEILAFRGEDQIFVQIPDGPVRDLGLVFRRENVRADFALVQIDGRPRSFAFRSSTILLFAISGMVDIEAYPEKKLFHLRAGDTLRLNPGEREALVTVEPKSATRLVAVELYHR